MCPERSRALFLGFAIDRHLRFFPSSLTVESPPWPILAETSSGQMRPIPVLPEVTPLRAVPAVPKAIHESQTELVSGEFGIRFLGQSVSLCTRPTRNGEPAWLAGTLHHLKIHLFGFQILPWAVHDLSPPFRHWTRFLPLLDQTSEALPEHFRKITSWKGPRGRR